MRMPDTPGCTTRLTGKKDLLRLPGLVAIAYQHETSRCGDPHLHTHVIVPNRQARADGQLVSIDWHVAVSRSQGGRGDLSGHAAPGTAPPSWAWSGTRSTAPPGWPRSPAWTQRLPSPRGRSAPPSCASGRRTTSSSSTGRSARRSWRPRRRPPARPNPRQLAWGAAQAAVARRCARPAAGPRGALRGARRAAPRRARVPLDRRAHRDSWRRGSTRPRSPAPTWSRSSARNCPSTHPAIHAELIEAAVDDVGVRLTAPRAGAPARGPREVHPGPRSWPRKNGCWRWWTLATRGRGLRCAATTSAGLSADQKRAIRTSARRRGWCSRWPRRPARARPPRCARCAPRRTGGGKQRAGAGADRQGRRCGRARGRRRPRAHRRQSATPPQR